MYRKVERIIKGITLKPPRLQNLHFAALLYHMLIHLSIFPLIHSSLSSSFIMCSQRWHSIILPQPTIGSKQLNPVHTQRMATQDGYLCGGHWELFQKLSTCEISQGTGPHDNTPRGMCVHPKVMLLQTPNQQTFLEHFLCTRCYRRCWGVSNK